MSMGEFTRYTIRSTNRGLWTVEADPEAFILLSEIAIHLVRDTKAELRGLAEKRRELAEETSQKQDLHRLVLVKYTSWESLLRGTGPDVSNIATTEAVVVGGYPGLGFAGLCESGGGVVM